MHPQQRTVNPNELADKHERPLFIIHLILSTLFWLTIITLTLGKALIYAAIFAVSYLFTQSALIAWIKGNGIKVSDEQFPDLYEHFKNCCVVLGIKQQPGIYLINGDGIMNAFAARFLGKHWIVLHSDIVDALSENPEAVNFYIGHELGHIRSGHLFLGPYLWPSGILPLIGSAYSRAREYSCDQFGRACCKNSRSAVQGLIALAAGRKRWLSTDIPVYTCQAYESSGFWMSFHELVADYPWLSKRAMRLHDPDDFLPPHHKLSWLLALFVPRLGKSGMVLTTIALIGVLAAIALPAYQSYTMRAKQLQSNEQTQNSASNAYRVFDDDQTAPEALPKHVEAKQAPLAHEAPDREPTQASANINFTLDQRIQAAAGVIKNSTPEMIDVYTRFDGVEAGPGPKISLTYTLVNVSASNQLPAELFNTAFGPLLKKSSCGSQLLKPLIDEQVSILHHYRGQSGFQIGTIAIDRNSCAL